MERIRIFLADDHVLFREALKQFLSAQEDMEVVGEAGTAVETVRRAPSAKAHVILLDITFPDHSGISVLPELRAGSPQSRIVMLTMHEDASYLRSAMAAGAAGYVGKSSAPKDLFDAIRSVHQGNDFVDPALRPLASEPKPGRGTESAPAARLSDREKQVLVLLSLGLRYKAVAEKMGITVKTVETYRSRLTAKLGFKDRADMIRFAVESGLLTGTPTER